MTQSPITSGTYSRQRRRRKQKSKTNIIFAAICVFVLVLAFMIFGSGDKFNEDVLAKIMTENGYEQIDAKHIKIENIIELNEHTQGLTGKNKLVLMSNMTDAKRKYSVMAVNVEDRKINELSYEFKPLAMLLDFISVNKKEVNIENSKRIATYINKYGFEFLKNQNHAEDFIRNITGNNGIILTSIAQQAITDSLHTLFSDATVGGKHSIVFEQDNALPMYYGVENIADGKSVWTAYDKNFINSGTFPSIEAFRARFSNVASEAEEAKRQAEAKAAEEKAKEEAKKQEEANKEAEKKENETTGKSNTSEKTAKPENKSSKTEIKKETPKTQAPVKTEPKKETTKTEDTKNSYSASSDDFYRIRTDFNDAKSQIGAFKNLEYAKQYLKEHGSANHKIYDSQGNVVNP